ncbi:hypothetical protein C8J57DRAFT_127240 [Mycena rebaudengoi]|nr:hypothetical protein C8J57DRAFT_127240 [Mycena rebaudengoi]
MKTQEGIGKIKQLFKQADIYLRLERCKDVLETSLRAFRTQAGISIVAGATQMKKEAKQNHEELVALLASYPELTDSDQSSSVTGSRSILGASSGSISMLPASPKIFNGRNSELQEIIRILQQDTARIAILGAGGMGKTSLAMAVIHHPSVVAKYQLQYFVGCHSAATRSDLVASISTYIGVEKGPGLLRRVVHHFKLGPPSLLVLDNFETVWEPKSSRKEVEDVLSLLADVSHLAIIVTIRGAERPGNVKWNRPFLLPLQPLSDSAAHQTFIEIADDVHEDKSVKELLALTDNLPLAISLIASLAASEGCEAILARWKTEKTRILSDGYDQRSSLDISILLSLYSPRMTPDAQDLLSILSFLPDGILDGDLLQMQLPMLNVLGAKSVLLQTTLAYIGNDRRLRVLVPIREHILSSFPPSVSLKVPILHHFQHIVGLWKPTRESHALTAQITHNLGNINNILLDAMDTRNGNTPAVSATVVNLNNFYRTTGRGISPAMLCLTEYQKDGHNRELFRAYVCERLLTCIDSPIPDPETQIALGHQAFEHSTPLEQAVWNNALVTYYTTQGNNSSMALNTCRKALELSLMVDTPTNARAHALRRMSHLLSLSGDNLAAIEYARKALQCAEALGDILGQAHCTSLAGTCYGSLGDLKSAAQLNIQARELLETCGLHNGNLYLVIEGNLAEMHHLKTEYAESRQILLQSFARTGGQIPTMTTMFHCLNLALVEIAAGGDHDFIHKNIDTARHISRTLEFSFGELGCDTAVADLNLREGKLDTAKQLFISCFHTAQETHSDEAILFCLERLANFNYGMENLADSRHWSVILLGYSMKTQNKLSIMKALHCLGIIFLAEGDDSTALSLLQVALDGLTFIDVHQWRADCMVHMGDIFQHQGKITESAELWKTARTLFERSLQSKDVNQIDARLSGGFEKPAGLIGEKGETGYTSEV